MTTAFELLWLRRSPWLLIVRCAFLMAVILLAIGSLVPSKYLPEHPLRDKALHFAGYAVVSTLAMFAIRSPGRQVTCLLLLTVLGIALEFGQMLVPGRAFELWDMAANGCGVFLAFQASRLMLS
jgi:VanZ family protein